MLETCLARVPLNPTGLPVLWVRALTYTEVVAYVGGCESDDAHSQVCN